MLSSSSMIAFRSEDLSKMSKRMPNKIQTHNFTIHRQIKKKGVSASKSKDFCINYAHSESEAAFCWEAKRCAASSSSIKNLS